MTLHLGQERTLDGGVVEQDLTIGEAPGILWTPAGAVGDASAPLVLLGHPGGVDRMRPRLLSRAREAAAQGFASATLELPGVGGRTPVPGADEARAALRAAVTEGHAPSDDVVDALVLPLVEQAVPEHRALIDALLEHPAIGGPVAVSGGNVSVAVKLALDESRIVAASLFAGSWVPCAILAAAGDVTIPVHMLLQWDDEGNDRQQALDLFDALGSTEKTLQANLGGHTGVPAHAGEDAARFLARHLTRP